tara:strand:+ start:375 stop:605 length:231 start_codon:yes stop_codon:yes gene_type:complete
MEQSKLILEFTFVTTHEKCDIMISSPEKHIIYNIGENIMNNRKFTDKKSMDKFKCELNKLLYNRSLGKPKIMHKSK